MVHTMMRRQSLQKMVLGKLNSYMGKKMMLEYYLIPYTKISLIWINGLNMSE